MSRAVLTRALWLLAAISLSFGVWRSAQPEALVDFQRVVAWTGELAAGTNPWAVPDSETDYPPWAIVTLMPLQVVPDAARAPLWIAVNLGLAVLVCLSLVRLAGAAGMCAHERQWLFAVLLAASCFRVLGQFSLVSFALALAGSTAPSPWRGGVLLGLALMKPQVGGVLWLAHLLMRDWRRTAVAATVPAALLIVAAVLCRESPLVLLGHTWHTLEAVHGGAELFTGHTELEGWLAPLWPGVTTVAGSGVVALALAAPVVWTVVVRGRPWSPSSRLELYALVGTVSLLSTRHLSYDFLLLLPVLAAWRPGARPVAWWLTAAALVAQLPGWWRRVFEPMGLPEWVGLATELDRLLCLCLYIGLLWSLRRLNMTE